MKVLRCNMCATEVVFSIFVALMRKNVNVIHNIKMAVN